MNDKYKAELLADWLRHSKSDLRVARHSFEDLWPKETEIAAYLCQQCAEKALKAFLVAHDIEPPRTHDLVKLVALCKNIDGRFSIMETTCKRLTPFGSEIRYPNELTADDAIVKIAIEDAQKVYDFCVEKINALSQTIAPPEPPSRGFRR